MFIVGFAAEFKKTFDSFKEIEITKSKVEKIWNNTCFIRYLILDL